MLFGRERAQKSGKVHRLARRRSHCAAGALRRGFGPFVTALEDRTLLTTPTFAYLTVSTSAITYGQQAVLTASVTTDPVSTTVPSGGKVSFIDGGTTLATENLGSNGTVTYSTTALPAGDDTITVSYSGDPEFGASTTPAAPIVVINTVAGGGNGDGGQATATALDLPYGVVIDSQGDLFFTDSGENEVREVNASTVVITTVAGTGAAGYSGDGGLATAAELDDPTGLAIDASGDLFIADTGNNVIREVSNGVITTVAGDGTFGYSGDGGSATSAELDAPLGVAVDSKGNLYIADTGNNVIREVSAAIITTIAGDFKLGPGYNGNNTTATLAQLDNPSGIAVDKNGDVFIADTGNNLIREVSGGALITVAGDFSLGPGYSGNTGAATSAQLDQPTAVAVDSSGDLLIADSVNSVVREVTAGTISTIAGDGIPGDTGNNGPATSAELGDPVGLAVQSTTGDLWIADSAGDVVREVSNGTITTVAGDGFENYGGDGGAATAAEMNNPRAIAVDSSGDLFIADTFNNVVREVNATTGVITTTAGDGIGGYAGDGGQATDAELLDPTGVAVDSALDLLFIADSGNNVIRQVDLQTGVITTVAGDYDLGPGYSGDGGSATAAQLNVPTSVAVDSNGNLFIADSGNNVVREVSGGDVSTVAGNFVDGAGYSGDGSAATSAQLSDPVAVAVDANDDLFIADTGNDVIREVAGGDINTIAGDYEAGPGYSGDGNAATSAQLDQPEGVAVNSAGTELYIADAGSEVVREVSSGIINTVAGDNTYGYSGDGSQASDAALSNPYGVAVNGSGDVFIADTFNNAIREITTLPNSSALPVAVTPAVLTVAATSFQIPYGSTVPALTYQISGFVNNDTSSVITGKPVLSTTANDASPVGTYPIDVNVSGLSAANYTFAAQDGTLTISQATPSIVWSNPAPITYGTALSGKQLDAAASVGGTFSYSPALNTVMDAGIDQTIKVTFTPNDTIDYAVTTDNVEITVNSAVLTVTANNALMTYGGTVPALGDTITGFVNGDTSGVVSGQAVLFTSATSASAVGEYPIDIEVGGLSAANYTFVGDSGIMTVDPAVLTVTANNASMTFGSTLPAFSDTITGFLNGDTASVVSGQASLSASATSSSAVGEYAINVGVSGLAANNYTFTGQSGTLTITKTTPVITWNPLAEIVYATPLSSAELNATSSVAGQFVYSPPLGTILNAALYQTLSVTFTPTDTTDYTDASASVDITVLRADLTVTANDATMTYGGNVPAFSDTITGFVNGDNSSVVSGQVKLTTTATSASPVGSYPIVIDVSQMIAENYVFGGVAGTLLVNPAVLTVTPGPVSMTYGSDLPVFSPTFIGLLNGDTAADLSGQATFSTTATSASPVGSYPLDINVSGLSATNYTFTGKAGTLNVTPVPLVITASSASITFGQAIPAFSVTYSGFKNGDTTAVFTSQPIVTTNATAESAPGVYPVVAAGAAAANYSISYVAGTLTINEQKGVEVTGYPPTVENVSIESVKVGKHSKAKVIVLQLSEAVNAAGADNKATYSLVTIPSKKKQKSKAVALSKAVYSPTSSGSEITLYTKKRLVLSPPLLLTVMASGIIDSMGRELDGNDSSQSGTNYVATISKSGVKVDSARTAGL
jgi:hypothetical protein